VVAPYEAVSSVEEIEAAKAKGIRFIQLQFTDIMGIVKAVTIPIHQLEGSVRHGTWFDGSSVEGFTRIAESDQYLMPDMRTFSEIPWSGGTAARVICDVYTPRGEAFGIRVEAAHHEVAAGQHEIDFEYADALQTADNAITFKFTLKAIAQQHGLYATFMPKPIHGINGSGMHTHQSLFSIAESRNSFADAESSYGLSPLAKSYMAGILAHARGMISVLAPLVNSYKRLVPGYEAPTYLTWGRTNRSALIRVPMVSPGKSIEGTRVEVRCPDPSSNTYLAFAAMIASGLDGVEKGLELAEPVEESLFEMDAATIAAKSIKELPGTLGEALDELEKDAVVREALGDHVYNHFVDAKRAEWDEYRTQVSDWEVDKYLEQF
jgi:glutamine synthetase